jgi:hypothetical protein
MFKGSYDLIKAIVEKVQLPADLKMLLIGIANHWSKDNPNPFPEYTTLVVEAGIPKRTLPRKLKAWKEAGWLEWEHGRGRSNIYTLAVEKIAALSATMALPEMVRPDLALPNEAVAPKLGTLTNIEDPVVSTPMRAKDVEPVPQEAPIPHPLLPAFSPPPPQAPRRCERNNRRRPPGLFAVILSGAKDLALPMEVADAKELKARFFASLRMTGHACFGLSPILSQLPPGWDIRGSSGGWSAYGPHYKHFGPFPTRDEVVASAYKVAEMPRKAAEPFMPVAVPTPSPPP